jgi:hypothetical protein
MLVGDSLSNEEGGDAEHDPAVMTSISARVYLSPLPQNLFDLWQEHIEGIGGRKPERKFSFLSGVMSSISFTASDFVGNDFWAHTTRAHI